MYRNLNPSALGVSGRQSEIIELSLSFGFKGIDVDLVEFQQAVKASGLPHARRLLDSARLKLSSFRLPLVWDDSDETYKSGLAALEESAALAASLGLSTAVTAISPANDLRPYHENFEFHRRRLTEVGEFLAKHRLKLGVEFRSSAELRKDRAFQFIHTFEALATLISMIRAANVCAVVDLFELYASGGTLDDLQKLGDGRIASVIVSDAPNGKAAAECVDADRLLPSETGAIDLAAALAVFAKQGFDGPITPAVSSSQTKGLKREQVVKTASERLSQAWNAAGLNPAGRVAVAGKK